MCSAVGVGHVVGGVLWDGLDDLIQEKNEEEYVMIEVRPEGYTDGSGSDITLNRRICEVSSDIRRYATCLL